MKLQHLAVLFIVIMLPISLIISAYTQIQIDALTLQQQYDANLKKAAYDAIKAFDINTTISDVSNVADSLRDNVQSSITTFIRSFSTTLGMGGYNEKVLKPYIPAILFTLYDGYYIYAPTRSASGEYEYLIQPYNYYSIRYRKDSSNDIVINYTLDNYIVVYGYIGGTYKVRSGYLVNNTHTVSDSEIINEYVPGALYTGTEYDPIMGEVKINKATVTDGLFSPSHPTALNETALYPRNDVYYIEKDSAKKYYEEAIDNPSDPTRTFRYWVDHNLNWVEPDMAIRNNDTVNRPFKDDHTKIFNISSSNDPEKEDSAFNIHRIEVIKNCIQDDLNYAITAYSKSEAETNYDYRLPQLNADEWLMISSNICMVPFVQGMPVGTRFYNNYTIVKSSTNKFFAEPENIYFVDENEGEDVRSYHRIDCPYLNKNSNKLIGFSSYEFQPFYVNVPENNAYSAAEDIWYWRRREKACYHCIVSSSYTPEFADINSVSGNKAIAYYTAVARERYRQYRTTNYLKEEIEAL